MRGRSIYFTAEELAAMEKFFDDFDIYFSYSEIDFMSRFFISLDYFFPEADDKPLKEKFIALSGSAFNKFFLCLDKYYGSEHLFPLG